MNSSKAENIRGMANSLSIRIARHRQFFGWKKTVDLWKIRKESSKPEVTNNNGCYSLAGAQFGVYRDGDDYVNPDAVITTDENGYGRVDGLPAGDYWIKELKAPQGFALNKEWVIEDRSRSGRRNGILYGSQCATHGSGWCAAAESG